MSQKDIENSLSSLVEEMKSTYEYSLKKIQQSHDESVEKIQQSHDGSIKKIQQTHKETDKINSKKYAAVIKLIYIVIASGLLQSAWYFSQTRVNSRDIEILSDKMITIEDKSTNAVRKVQLKLILNDISPNHNKERVESILSITPYQFRGN